MWEKKSYAEDQQTKIFVFPEKYIKLVIEIKIIFILPIQRVFKIHQ